MKKFFLFFACVLSSLAVGAENVFTLTYASSDDGFVNVRTKPSAKSAVVDKIYGFYHGIGHAMLVSEHGKWVKVRTENGKVGYAAKRYLGFQNWYNGRGRAMIVANKEQTPIFVESNKDGSPEPFMTVDAGTIVADEFEGPNEQGCYVLKSAHDYLFVKASDVRVVNRF